MAEKEGKLWVVGIGPGAYEDMTVRAARILEECDTIVGYTVYVDIDIKFNSNSYYAILGLPNGYKPIANSDVTICINGGDLDAKSRSYLRLKPFFVQPYATTGGKVQIYYNYQAFG